MNKYSLINQKPKALLLENIHTVARDLFIQSGVEVELLKTALDMTTLVDKLKDFDILGVRSKTQIPEKVFEKCPRLYAAGCFCVGTSHVDLEAGKKHGVSIFNAPFANTRSVAEMVMSHIVSLARQIGQRNLEMHQGVWNKKSEACYEIRGKTLGIIGYGNIGSQVSHLAESMGLRVLYYDVLPKLTLGNARPCPVIDDVLKESDFITLHVPLTALTENMIGAEELKMMKRGAFLINASRGTVVEIPALAEAIKTGHLGGAAIDVFPQEPEANSKAFESPLVGLTNVILTPHVGGATEEAQSNIGREVANSLIRFIWEGATDGSVNFPIVHTSPVASGGHRLLNVHKNVPGVLKDINQIVSQSGANIQSQNLATDPEVGYLVMDFDRPLPVESVGAIDDLETSIRTRVIG
jgi:D-3-phosphoglycerate dehydrogenase / 2-oxoglutarate reductase